MVAVPCTGKVILVVEDNDIARVGLSGVLQNAGFAVVPLENGQMALDYLRAGQRPDLILLDMLMPAVDGWKFLKELRDWSKPVNVPIIVTTGTILTKEWAAQHGLAGLLRKPIETADLLADIRRCLSC